MRRPAAYSWSMNGSACSSKSSRLSPGWALRGSSTSARSASCWSAASSVECTTASTSSAGAADAVGASPPVVSAGAS
ncbi:hypothetical protein BC477_16245 [Clavibacter michiganensis subsp. michiganensis]|uniref:Uncharacterized protein n=1 Tax=Clavibacter michiganensis subsp. michiganensis TaxID=33013 RepID=A0A251XFM8_CLAMM|nr:hypothetical protein BC477_16245 [Clavibacter michiganensis subsp. michiganensis]OUE01358.1 hypothetical protein CMMCAS07_13695 [Clavibacter michiganensis subsp. michiganensis]